MHFTITYRQTLVTLLFLGVMALSACGYKTDVYYPTEEQRQALAAKEKRIEARKAAKLAAKKTHAEQQTTNDTQ